MKLIIFDRDGTLIENIPYLKDINLIRFKPGVIPTLRELQTHGFQMVVATNQSGIGRKILSETQLKNINNEIAKRLLSEGVKLDEFICCPHIPMDHCNCRKPNNGMIEEIIKKKKVDRDNVVFVGDQITDGIAASKSKVKSTIVSADQNLGEYMLEKCEVIVDFQMLINTIIR